MGKSAEHHWLWSWKIEGSSQYGTMKHECVIMDHVMQLVYSISDFYNCLKTKQQHKFTLNVFLQVFEGIPLLVLLEHSFH